MITDWLYQGLFTLQTQGNDPNQPPLACVLHALTGPRQDGGDGEPAHLLMVDTPLPLQLPKIAEQLVAFFHINPMDQSHIFLLHTPPGGALLRHVFVQFFAEWEQLPNGTWTVPQPGWRGKRCWRETHVSVAKEPEYTALLHPPVRMTLSLLDPLADGGQLFYADIRDGIRFVWNQHGTCILLSDNEVPNYLTLGRHIPCFATPYDASRFLQESHPSAHQYSSTQQMPISVDASRTGLGVLRERQEETVEHTTRQEISSHISSQEEETADVTTPPRMEEHQSMQGNLIGTAGDEQPHEETRTRSRRKSTVES